MYNLLGQLIVVSDALGSRTNTYNNQGLLTSISTSAGFVQQIDYDIFDRPVAVTNQNGVVINRTFDWLGRVCTNAYANDATERYGYSAAGLTAYTNQLNCVTSYAYDAARHKTNEVNANNETIAYTYNAAGDLLTLRDGKSQQTTWAYDVYGSVTNKADANNNTMFRYRYDILGRLTNRWTPAKGYTGYAYDAVGNLTNINYPSIRTFSWPITP